MAIEVRKINQSSYCTLEYRYLRAICPVLHTFIDVLPLRSFSAYMLYTYVNVYFMHTLNAQLGSVSVVCNTEELGASVWLRYLIFTDRRLYWPWAKQKALFSIYNLLLVRFAHPHVRKVLQCVPEGWCHLCKKETQERDCYLM